MRHIFPVLCVLSLLAALPSAEALQVRFYPAKQLRAYELDPAQGLRSVVLQNVAIINDGEGEIVISRVELDLVEAGVASEIKMLRPPELDRMAANASQLQQAGMFQVLAFQYGGPALLPRDVTVSSKRSLKPGEALVLTQQVLTFSGTREALWVRVETSAGVSNAAIAISMEPSSTAFQLPLRGMWHDGAAPSLHSHHRWIVPQEFAHDFTRIGADGLAYRGDGRRLSDYYAYGEPVFAAAAGRVVAVLNDEPEDATLLQGSDEPLDAYLKRLVRRQNEQLTRGVRGIVGNHVLISHGEEYSLYAHLRPGSVTVKAGDEVSKGQQIASVGSSGSSTEPHLHFHVCDAPDVLLCAGIPARFENLEIYGALQARQLQSGDLVRNRPVTEK